MTDQVDNTAGDSNQDTKAKLEAAYNLLYEITCRFDLDTKFTDCIFNMLGFPVASKPETRRAKLIPFRLGNEYQTLEGKWVRFTKVHNEGTDYETMEDEHGVNRYTSRDFGRVTGTAHDYSYQLNTPPLYTNGERRLYGYAVEAPDGHIMFFKEDPKGMRQWEADGLVKVRELFTEDCDV